MTADSIPDEPSEVGGTERELPEGDRWSGLQAYLPFAIPLVWLFVLHRPALLNFGRAIPGSEDGDTIRGHWSAWLVSQDTWPIPTTLTAWPEGAHFLALPPFTLAVLSPFTSLLGAATSLSLLIFLHGLLSIAATYFLARTLNCGRWPSLMAGLLASSVPMLGEILAAGVYEYQTLGWMALCFAALLRACQGKWIWGVAAGVLYMLTTWECGYYGSAAALGCIVIVLSSGWYKPGLVGAAVAGAVVILLAAVSHGQGQSSMEGSRNRKDRGMIGMTGNS